MKKWLIASLFVIGLIGLDAHGQQAQTIGLIQFEELMADEKAQLLDVRTPNEFKEGTIPGANNLDFYALDFQQSLTKLKKKDPVLVFCKSGGRSAKTMKMLSDLGFKKVYDLKGGYNTYKAYRVEK